MMLRPPLALLTRTLRQVLPSHLFRINLPPTSEPSSRTPSCRGLQSVLLRRRQPIQLHLRNLARSTWFRGHPLPAARLQLPVSQYSALVLPATRLDTLPRRLRKRFVQLP